MRIELRGIIQANENGHTETSLVVTEDRPDQYKRHFMGIDIKLNRGRIITFLSAMYGVPPGEIIWPEHIDLKTGVE